MPSGSNSMPALPAGFRFHPTDEELIVHYLMNQAAAVACPVPIIAEVDIYKCNPWDLPAKAVFGEKEWYFFSPRDRKYPNGGRPNRAAGAGYWKATGTDKAIVSTPTSRNIGVKKALVFYRGKPPRGVKTDWIMHEYRIAPATASSTKRTRSASSMRLDDWVLCRIYKKSNDFQIGSEHDHEQGEDSTLEDASLTGATVNIPASSPESEIAPAAAPAMDMDMAIPNSRSLTNLLATIDYTTLSQLLLDAPEPEPEPAPSPPSPLIYTGGGNMISNDHITMEQQVDACSEYYGTNDGGLKRMRVATDTDSEHIADRSFEDGSSLSKKLQLLPGDSRMSSYCSQQIADESAFQFQYSSLLSHSLLSQQLLLSNHLQMQ